MKTLIHPFGPGKREVLLSLLRYSIRCEEYDRTVCANADRRTGEAIPLTSEEMRLVNAHARKVRTELNLLVISGHRWAEEWVNSLPFEEQQRALAALERTA